MGLSRLDNFLKSVRGTILYVDPNSLDATDSIENQGNSLTRPFRTIQRALIEAARFSYQSGLNNDRFGNTTILLYPGEHLVDNRPGWIPDGSGNFRLRSSATSNNFTAFDLNTSFDLTNPDNALYKLNSVHGGVIIPRGTSIVGLDLRKTKVRPLYVPDPAVSAIERSTIFRVTGGCYFWQFSIFDADPNSTAYFNYTNNRIVPNYSHHKLTCFEYADGTNNVYINDDFQTYSATRTDLEMYYEKVGLAYGQSSGRPIEPDYPDPGLDIQPKIDEYRIVGSIGQSVGISSIIAGDGTSIGATPVITVTLDEQVDGLDVDTPFRIEGISGYNGQYVVSEKLNNLQIQYEVQNAPSDPNPSVTGSKLSLNSDTVTSASPYIFNISLRSVWGMCGILADGSKASGFKSMIVAQFTGIGLQKDDNAFILYDTDAGTYIDNSSPQSKPLSTNSRSIFKPEYKNFHIKAINDAFIQNVSVFAIGYAEHFAVESGGDMSITNSNSNFGAKALVASGFRKNAFAQDDLGYITHIIPPKEIPIEQVSIEFDSVAVGIASTNKLYLYNKTNSDIAPENVLEGYRIGASTEDNLRVLVSVGGTIQEKIARIVMPGSNSSAEKVSYVSRTSGTNNITSNVITLTQAHSLYNGESVRVLSDNGQLPDGLSPNLVYYAITSDNASSGLTTTTQIKLAKTQNDAVSAAALDINDIGGSLKIVSRVSDKNSGDIGHPIQFDSTQNNWYINVSGASTENTIYSTIVGLGTTVLGEATTRTYIKRKQDDRNAVDTIYRVRYVIPSNTDSVYARPPSDGFIIQESNSSIGSTDSEIAKYFGTGTIGEYQLRNPRFIADATWSTPYATIKTELPHNLVENTEVEILNVRSSNNTSGANNTGYNGTYTVYSTPSSREFVVGITTDPGTFTSDTSSRTTSLPYFKKKKYSNTYYIYRTQEVKKFVPGEQDGVYYLTLINSSNSSTITDYDLNQDKFSQPVKELYPQINRDNPVSDPEATTCFAQSSLIGEVVVDDVRKSLTKETILKKVNDNTIGVGITDIASSSSTNHTIHTKIDHGLNRITILSITGAGSGYGSGTAGSYYNVPLVGVSTGQYATAKITLNSSGAITDAKIMHGGSCYSVGDTLTISGISTTIIGGFSQATLTVSQIYNNVGDVIRVSGVSSESNIGFNDLYRITQVNNAKRITATSSNAISGTSALGIGVTVTSSSFAYVVGESIRVSSLDYNNTTGIATVTTVNNHGLKVNTKVRLTGANESLYNGDFIVTENVSLTSFKLKVGIGTTAPAATGTIYAYREGITSNDGVVTENDENISGRMVSVYAGITTTLSALIPDATIDQINVRNVQNLDINVGDYLLIDEEIVRVKTAVPSTPTNPVYVFRGAMGTRATNHDINSVVRRIKVNPVELRRHSIIRASGHTFEYVGFGPGNYSTAFPDKQDRQITPQEELLAQSTRKEGGINFYTGMNDKGISYSGNKKLSTVTGQEEIFDTPILTVTGEDIGALPGINVINPLEGNFGRSIRVEGGSDGNATSEFNGPVIFRDKLTSVSDRGIEANSLYLQGDTTVSRKYTVGISQPTLAGTPGDVVYYDNPTKGGYLGWVYTKDNAWYGFGNVSLEPNSFVGGFDKVGIATTSPGTCSLKVGSGTSMFCVDGNGVGIATTTNSSYKLTISGNVSVAGTTYSTKFIGDGSGLTNLPTDSIWQLNSPVLYVNPTFTVSKVGIGTTVPRFNLELGTAGAGTTDLWVNNNVRLDGFTSANNVNISGVITATSYNFSGGTGTINSGIVTTADLRVGTSGTTLYVSSGIGSVGIGTTVPRTKLDVEGLLRVKTTREAVQSLSIVSNVVTVDLSQAQNFTLSLTDNINHFIITNCPAESSSFTIKIAQDSTGSRTVDIDDIRTSGGSPIDIYWAGGGIVPTVTPTASRSDIYTFKTFDGGTSFYGVVVGQNFAN